jgi:hypothetical protein
MLLVTNRYHRTGTGSVTVALDGTAADAAGNTGTASVTMVTLDNTDPVITGEAIDMPSVMTSDNG